MPRYGEDKITEIRERADLVDVVSRHVSLKRSGRNHVGLCPFHAEKTPSFNVNEERAFFHCFGCGESGDVFTFLMKMDGLTFPDAVEQLAGECGIELPKHPEEARSQGERERLAGANRLAARFFWRTLWESRTGEKARKYLESRGIHEETARVFGLGYAPPQGLAAELEQEKVSLRDAEALGLVGRSRQGGWYDRFRDRLIFPIVDLSGRVAGFGGRILDETEGGPKYLNSPDSTLFRKRRLLFGLSRAREAIRERKRVLVVEGYLDVIALAQSDLAEVVAPLGTAVTEEQVRVLRRFSDRIVVLFDGDEAGGRAASRSFPVFAAAGVFADAAFLPEGDDPDTFVRREGPQGLEARLAGKSPLIDHFLASLLPEGAGLPERKRAGDEIAELLQRVTDPVFSGMVARRASEFLDLSEESLLSRARQRRRTPPAREKADPPETTPRERLSSLEGLLLEVVLVKPALAEELPPALDEILESEAGRAVFREILENPTAFRPEAYLHHLPANTRDRVARLLLAESTDHEAYAGAEQMLRDCIARLEQRRRRARLLQLRDAIRAAESRDDQRALQELLAEKSRLDRQGA